MRAARPRPIPLPRWSDRRGWSGGDPKRLYAYVDRLTGQVHVRPGGAKWASLIGNAEVRPATRAEAERGWQNPLNPGWKVVE